MVDLFSIFQSMEDGDLETRESIVKAPFSYPGGKTRSLKYILPELPYTDYYCEPFGGAATILLSRRQSKIEVFNDRYSGVTDFYHCVKNREMCEKLIAWLDMTCYSREEFLRCRDTWQDTQDPVERAARWYYMSRASFQSMGRNFGRSKKAKQNCTWKIRNSLKEFWPAHYRFSNVLIENQDWRQLFKDWNRPDMVWYLDPTYYDTSTGMYPHEMTKEDHAEMLERIHNDLTGFVALSGYDNTLYNSKPWDRKINWEQNALTLAYAFTDNNNRKQTESLERGTVQECLWIKNRRF